MRQTISPSFPATLEAKQRAVQPGIDMMVYDLHALVAGQPPPVQEAMYVGTRVMQRPAKRIRGVLTETGYRTLGGTDTAMISQAAGAVEAWHTNLLITDDHHDNTDMRRGDVTAHVAMASYLHEHGIGRNPKKLGADCALNAGFIMHMHANRVLGGLAVPSDNKILASNIASDYLVQTGIGQARDLLADPAKPPTPTEILETYRLKTGLYTFKPLAVGAALAGAPAQEIELLTPYAESAGKAFQLQDDVLGVVGDPAVTGKPQKSDIAEGKHTWIVATALERISGRDRGLLLRSLGNAALSDEDFSTCRMILDKTSAIDEARELAREFAGAAINSLDRLPTHWQTEQIVFMRDLAVYGATREA